MLQTPNFSVDETEDYRIQVHAPRSHNRLEAELTQSLRSLWFLVQDPLQWANESVHFIELFHFQRAFKEHFIFNSLQRGNKENWLDSIKSSSAYNVCPSSKPIWISFRKCPLSVLTCLYLLLCTFVFCSGLAKSRICFLLNGWFCFCLGFHPPQCFLKVSPPPDPKATAQALVSGWFHYLRIFHVCLCFNAYPSIPAGCCFCHCFARRYQKNNGIGPYVRGFEPGSATCQPRDLSVLIGMNKSKQ